MNHKAITHFFVMSMLAREVVFCQSKNKDYYRWAEQAIKQCHDFMLLPNVSLEDVAMYARAIERGMMKAYNETIPCHAGRARGYVWGAREVVGIIERTLFPDSLFF
jgi:hypothetical protein